jgi:2,3,4,5-tetrahydropyridine-2-carboxylate N-succinyltransferase
MSINTVKSVDEFKALVEKTKKIDGYREPIAFGIARVDRGQKNANKVLQANYAIVNWRENYGSASIFIGSLIDAGIDVDFSGSEFLATLNDRFVSNAMASFAPYLPEAVGDAHKNVQVIKSLASMEDIGKDFRITFLFEDSAPKSGESV